MRRRLDTLVALGIVFLLIGSMPGVLAYRQAMSSNQAGTTLWVVFNHNQQAMQIVLQSSAIKPYCNP